MNLILGGIYTSIFFTNIIIAESKQAYFMISIDNDYIIDSTNEEIIKFIKKSTEKERLKLISYSEKKDNYFKTTIDGYLGTIPNDLWLQLENLLILKKWYNKLK